MIEPAGDSFFFFLFPPSLRLDIDRRRVMEDPVQNGRSDDRITEDLVPLAETPVRGQDQGAFLIAPGDELKK